MRKLCTTLIIAIAIAIAASPQLAFAKKAKSSTTTTEKSRYQKKVTIGNYFGKITFEKVSKTTTDKKNPK